MKIRDVILAESLPLPQIPADLAYQFVVGGNGLFIRAEDSRMEAMVPVAPGHVHGLAFLEPYAKLKVPCLSAAWLTQVLESAQRHLPNEAMYQFYFDAESRWRCYMPKQEADAGHVIFDDDAITVVDLHSHGMQSAFFSEDIDDVDEQGLRFYAVIGKVDTAEPQIAVRVGVYGHFWNVPLITVFGGGPFMQVDPEVEYVLVEDEHE